jgi:hypothetical protein
MPIPNSLTASLLPQAKANPDHEDPAAFAQYDDRLPSPQNAVDSMPGWLSAFPPEFGVTAGPLAFYADARIAWCLDLFGSIAGRAVLELGPLEAGHTYMLERAGAATLDAVEANKLAYMRCLIYKEIVGLKVARFHLGDFTKWIEDDSRRYDLVIACGVLYHLRDPLRFLERIAQIGGTLFLWTHYLTDRTLETIDPKRIVFSLDEVADFRGLPVRLYRCSYRNADKNSTFCGGIYDEHRWLHRDDLLTVLGRLGFNDIKIGQDQPDHPNGPAFSVFARKLPVATG